MLTIEHRPMTVEERAALAGMRESPRSASVWMWLSIWIACLWLPWFISLRAGKDNTSVLLFGTSLLVGYAIVERWWKRRVKRLGCVSALNEGNVEVFHVEVSDAAEVEEVEDLGLNFFLDIGDSKLLFLTGQYLYELACNIGEDEVERPGKFPNKQFDIVRALQSRRLLGFECTGEPFRPSKIYKVPNGEKRFFELHDGQIIPGRVGTLEEDLRKLGIRIEPCERR